MPEEFGTVNLKQGAQTREIELLRRHYRTHRDSLARMISDAPTEHLASEYQRLISEIDMAVRKLDELEGKPATSTASPSDADTSPSIKTGPGTRPLIRTGESAPPPMGGAYRPLAPSTGVQSRVAMIVIAGVVVLAIIGWLIWRASSERRAAAPVLEQQPVTSTNNAPPPAVTPAPIAAAVVLKVAPAVADYGTIRKGTRAVRQFQVTNLSDGIVEIEVPRSNCRCLFYDYNSKLP
ncbi:MAG TPA: hypothetical protein VII12_01595, partial [Thermoanaerobaculia bacterium]